MAQNPSCLVGLGDLAGGLPDGLGDELLGGGQLDLLHAGGDKGILLPLELGLEEV